MKKRILITLAALIILLCVPLIVSAQIIDSGSCGADGDNVTWTLDDEGTLTISGIGDMADYSNSIKFLPWYYSRSNITKVIIEQGVTSIGDYAFDYCESLTNITIPHSVTSIGEYAFAECTSLTNITIPDSVTSIGMEVFFYCGSLNINVSPNNKNYCDIDGVLFTKDKKTILAYAKDKLQLEYVIPSGVTSIDDDAFCFCESLTNITIPDSVTSIGYGAFKYCTSLTRINIPESVTSIGDWAFEYCESLTSVNIPNGVTSIGDGAFYGCESLTSINIPDSVTSIGDWAFVSCTNLTNIAISKGVTNIGDSAFYKCESLTNITIPDSVTSIGDETFRQCHSLTNITIPDSVTSIGYGAFEGCNNLTDVYYSGTEQEWKLINIDNSFGGNDYLLNATIHYNSKMPIDPLEVQPVEPEKDTEANKITIPVTVTDAERAEELNDVRLYIAEYDADGRLTNVTFGEKGAVEGDTIIFTADIPDAEHYKIMLWDANNAPLMDAVDSI